MKMSGLIVAVLALAFSFLTPASPAQAYAHGFFQIVNKSTGKCLEWNGVNKKITQEKCKAKPDQWWENMTAKLCNYGSSRSDWCLGDDGKEKPVYGRHLADAPQLFFSSLQNHAQTTLGTLHCGYFKVVSGKVMCGKRILINHGHSYSPAMMWVIKY